MNESSAILLIACPDRQGIVAAVTRFLAERHGNVLDLEQHVDEVEGFFFMRLEWDLRGFEVSPAEFESHFAAVASAFEMTWNLRLARHPIRMGVFVTREPHCLYDLLARHRSGEWRAEIPLIVSNRDTLQPVAAQFGIPFHVVPVTPETRAAAESRALELLHAAQVDTVVLARYMQIVSADFIGRFPNRIINIHHSFLPAFAGARP
jgi:formyltetrahydrofolate deformylase